MNSILRPDERAAQASIGRAEKSKNVLTGAATAIGGAALSAKILPFLNEYIPVDLALKGISKVAPKIGQFLSQGQSMGLTPESGLEYLKGEVEKDISNQKTKESRNIIEQVSPELHTFIDQEIRKGRKPVEAGAIAQNDKRFGSIVKKLEKTHKTPWSQIIQSIYGTGETAQPNQQQAPQGQQQPGQGLAPGVAQIMQQGQAILQKFRGQG